MNPEHAAATCTLCDEPAEFETPAGPMCDGHAASLVITREGLR